jgi:hypothetical protein
MERAASDEELDLSRVRRLARSWLFRGSGVPAMRTRRRIYLILAVTSAMAFVAIASPWRVRDEAPAAAAPAQPAPRPSDRIHVERTLVRATEEVVEPPVRTERAHVQPRREAEPEAEAGPPPLISRARRVIFGSGRHRPEPFPRAGVLEAPAR